MLREKTRKQPLPLDFYFGKSLDPYYQGRGQQKFDPYGKKMSLENSTDSNKDSLPRQNQQGANGQP
jgi:hypothetical protein